MPNDMSKYMKLFLQDAEEQIAALSSSLLAMEKNPGDRGLLDRLFRAAHNLKGGSATIGLATMLRLTHEMENVLGALRSGQIGVSKELADCLFQCLDKLNLIVEQVTAGETGEFDIEQQCRRLRSFLPPDESCLESIPGMETPARQEAGGAAASPETENLDSEQATPQPATAPHPMATVRVDTDRLDALMNLAGELAINKTRFSQVRKEITAVEEEAAESRALPAETAHRLKALCSEFDNALQQMGRMAGELQNRVMQIRMLPISNVFMRFERAVRDLANQTGRLVSLEITGQDTQLDKTVIETIGDPLMHLVRNAVAHGIEPPVARINAGKPPEGRLSMTAFHEGHHVIIEIADDGRGIHPDQIKETAVLLGIISRERAGKLTKREAINLIFMPSFSTSESADGVSGRGVGMDVVARNIERLNGIIDVQTTPGAGTKFIIRIPLTLATIQALLVGVSGEMFAIPLVNIIEAVRIRPGDIEKIEGREATFLRDSVLSLLRLDSVLGLPALQDETKQFMYVVVIGLAEKRIGLVAHKLLGRQEIVMKSINEYFPGLPAIAGASILDDGRVSLILDAYSLIEMGIEHVNREVEIRRLGALSAR